MRKILLLLLPFLGFSQGYTSYFTGNTNNITTTPEFGVCMMGGATEHDNAMTWLLQKANGGDVVVLRSSGSNGYNDYLYSQLGVTVRPELDDAGVAAAARGAARSDLGEESMHRAGVVHEIGRAHV